jgi:ribosomal protein L11
MFDLYFKKLKELSVHKDIIIKSIISVKIPSGEASGKGSLQQILGQYGITIMDFCSKFNELTNEFEPGIILNTKIILYADMTYDIYLNSIDLLYYIRKILNINTFTPFGNRIFIGKGKNVFYSFITTPVLYEICKFHYNIFKYKHISLQMLYKNVCYMLKSIGILIIPIKKLFVLK